MKSLWLIVVVPFLYLSATVSTWEWQPSNEGVWSDSQNWTKNGNPVGIGEYPKTQNDVVYIKSGGTCLLDLAIEIRSLTLDNNSVLKQQGHDIVLTSSILPEDYNADKEFVVNNSSKFIPEGKVTIRPYGFFNYKIICSKFDDLSIEGKEYYSTLGEVTQYSLSDSLSVAGNLNIIEGKFISDSKIFVGNDFDCSSSLFFFISDYMKILNDIKGTGIIHAGKSTIDIEGDWKFLGNFVSNESTVIFSGNKASNIMAGAHFYKLIFKKESQKSEIYSSGVISFTNGYLFYDDNSYFRGGLRTKLINITDKYIKNYVALSMTEPGNVQVTRYTGKTPPGSANLALKNYLVIDESETTKDLSYITSFLNWDKEASEMDSPSNMIVWKSINSGDTWEQTSNSNSNSHQYTDQSNLSSENTSYICVSANAEGSLPVEFDEDYFFASSGKKGIELKWLTHSESGLKGFIVYRGENPDNIKKIYTWKEEKSLCSKNFMNGGTSTSDSYYNFVDKNVVQGKKYYYKISAFCSENDNEFHPKIVKGVWSKEIKAQIYDVSSYPNPFNSSTCIKFCLTSNVKNLLVKFYDARGRLISQSKLHNLSKGSHRLSLEGSRIPSGLIYYEVSSVGLFKHRGKMLHLK